MKITVLYFAQLEEQRGCPVEELEIDPGTSVGQLYEQLQTASSFTLTMESLRPAVQNAYVSWNHKLGHGDVVAFIPPVAGG